MAEPRSVSCSALLAADSSGCATWVPTTACASDSFSEPHRAADWRLAPRSVTALRGWSRLNGESARAHDGVRRAQRYFSMRQMHERTFALYIGHIDPTPMIERASAGMAHGSSARLRRP
jgi:hypothetical protein